MLVLAEPVTKEVEIKEEDQVVEVVDVTKPAASPELGPQVVEAMKKVREELYPAS